MSYESFARMIDPLNSKAPLMDPLLYYHASGGLNFNQKLNYTNLLFNLVMACIVIGIITCFLVWRKRHREKELKEGKSSTSNKLAPIELDPFALK